MYRLNGVFASLKISLVVKDLSIFKEGKWSYEKENFQSPQTMIHMYSYEAVQNQPDYFIFQEI